MALNIVICITSMECFWYKNVMKMISTFNNHNKIINIVASSDGRGSNGARIANTSTVCALACDVRRHSGNERTDSICSVLVIKTINTVCLSQSDGVRFGLAIIKPIGRTCRHIVFFFSFWYCLCVLKFDLFDVGERADVALARCCRNSVCWRRVKKKIYTRTNRNI